MDQRVAGDGIYIGSGDQRGSRRVIIIWGVIIGTVFAGLIPLAAYPFVQMFAGGKGNAALVAIFVCSALIILFVVMNVIRRLEKTLSAFTRKPYLILKPNSLVYSVDGSEDEILEVPWLALNVTHASADLFQATFVVQVQDDLDKSRSPVDHTLTVDIPLGGFERPGAEIVKLLKEHIAAAHGVAI